VTAEGTDVSSITFGDRKELASTQVSRAPEMTASSHSARRVRIIQSESALPEAPPEGSVNVDLTDLSLVHKAHQGVLRQRWQLRRPLMGATLAQTRPTGTWTAAGTRQRYARVWSPDSTRSSRGHQKHDAAWPPAIILLTMATDAHVRAA
jgi:hypothetical protein